MDDIVFLLSPEGMVRLLADRLRKNFPMPGQCPVRSHKMQSATGRKCVAVLGAFLWRNLLENWPTPSQIELLKEILICFPVSLACVFCAAIGLKQQACQASILVWKVSRLAAESSLATAPCLCVVIGCDLCRGSRGGVT